MVSPPVKKPAAAPVSPDAHVAPASAPVPAADAAGDALRDDDDIDEAMSNSDVAMFLRCVKNEKWGPDCK